MADDRTSPYEQAERNLTAWHATHPDATFYDMEVAVEAQIERLRTALLGSQTEGTFTEVMRQCAERRRQHMARRLAQQTASHPSSSDPPDINQRAKTIVDRHPTEHHPWNDSHPFPKTWAHPPTR